MNPLTRTIIAFERLRLQKNYVFGLAADGILNVSVMIGNKDKNRRPRPSIDGIVSSGGQLGSPLTRSYQPNRGPATPSLDNIMHRADGFHTSRPAGSGLGQVAETSEAAALLDEPILLDDQPAKKKKHYFGHKHPKLRKVFKRGGLSLLVLIVLIGGFLGWKLEKDISKVFHGNLFSLFHPVTKLKGEDQGRVNILLAGNSADDPGHNGANLTDSIMLISLDTADNTGYLLSIPRDLYVNYATNSCPYGNSGKINAVYECGQAINFNQPGYTTGGMGLLEKVVDQDFGVNVDYTALIDYAGLRDAVNAVGGISFTVNSPDSCGLYDGNRDYATGGILVNLSNGTHVLNGEQALDLARARGDPPYPSCGYENGDFTRTQNQRQELLSLKSKILSVGVLSNPAKLTSLLDTFGNSVQTSFQANEILRLYSLSKKIPNSSIQSIGLSNSNVNLVKTTDINGISYVIPTAGLNDFSDIQNYLQRLNSSDPVVKEDASVEILNGSNTDGLAAQTETTLTDKGLNVVGIGDDSVRPATVILVLNKNKPATEAYLKSMFKVTPTTNAAAYPETEGYSADFVIILGEDAASSQTTNSSAQ